MSKKMISLCAVLLLGAETMLGGKMVQATEAAPLAAYTVNLRMGQKQLIAPAALSVQLLEVKDSRCPVGARCIWAGQATATLLLSHAGGTPVSITIGTPTPPDMALPYQASSGDFRFTLTSLEPLPTTQAMPAPAQQSASVLVEKIR